MRRGILLLTTLLLAFVGSLSAQDTLQVKKGKDEPMGIDQQINAWIQPATEVIEGIVFYSFPIRTEVEYIKFADKIVDGDTVEAKIFMDPANCPYEMLTEAQDGKEYRVQYVDEASYNLKYKYVNEQKAEFEITKPCKFGETYTIKDSDGKDFTYTINRRAGFDGPINEIYRVTPNSVQLPIVLIVLIFGAIFFTVYFKFPNITRLKLSIDTVRGKYTDPDSVSVGEVTPFQALTAALSATVGLGNIAGVAIAITIGGPGATLWMILVGILGMASKFTECTLGVKYRIVGKDGTIYGGPMYYLSRGLKERGLGGLGKVLAGFFAVMCVGGSFGGGNMFQSNQAATQTIQQFGIESDAAGFIFGVIVAVLVGIVIIGGIKRIGKVTERVVPFMAILYVGASIVILITQASEIPHAFGLIVEGAFNPTAVAGGLLGVMIQGFRRAAFSNEAGVGSAAIAHSAVKTDYPASEGMVALLEPFVDTVVICTMTALVIIVTGNYVNDGGLSGVDLTSSAFEQAIPYSSYMLTLAVVLFAFSTMLSWSYYGLQAWSYLFGRTPMMELVYKIIFCIFVAIGASIEMSAVVGFSDAMIFAMVFPNIIGLILLAPKVRHEVHRYVNGIKTGEIKAYK